MLFLDFPSPQQLKTKRILTFYFNNTLVYFVYVISSCISHEILVSWAVNPFYCQRKNNEVLIQKDHKNKSTMYALLVTITLGL